MFPEGSLNVPWMQTKKGREVAMKAVKKVAMDTFVAMDTLVEGVSSNI
jgi:hypothetical protein